MPLTSGHGVITVTLGYGREIGHGEVARGTGYNAGALRGSTAMWVASGVQAARTGSTYQLVSSQDHGSMEGRPLFRTDTLANYKSNPTFAPDMSPMATQVNGSRWQLMPNSRKWRFTDSHAPRAVIPIFLWS